MRHRNLDGVHEFTEDVNDCSMCLCGIPALTHDLAMTDRSDAEQIARNASMAHHPAGGVDWTGLNEFLPPLVPMSSAVMADAQAEIAGMDRDEPPVVAEPAKLVPLGMTVIWRQLVESRAKLSRIEALIATWQVSPDMRIRSYGDRLSEVFDGRPRA